MKITLHTIAIKDLVEGYQNNDEEGVVGYGGRLNIRPPFQREFIYNDREKKEVINSIFKDYPLNVMYWVKNADGNFEMLDGQQRTVSICSYWSGEFFIEVDGTLRGSENLTDEQRDKFLNYALQIYICEDGTAQEQLDWFRIINIAGEKLTQQELRNAVYVGPWIADAKRRFSKTGCVAYQLGERYMEGVPLRQAYLETVLGWISNNDIDNYMAEHQNDRNSDCEWQYFQQVMAWVQTLFPKYRKEMKGLDWGGLYNRFKDKQFSATKLEEDVARLMMDDDVTNKKGIYDYVLSGMERKLSIRAFTPAMKRGAYERQNGNCAHCGRPFDIEEMEGDHITPWSLGGKTVVENCRMLCRDCNRTMGNH